MERNIYSFIQPLFLNEDQTSKEILISLIKYKYICNNGVKCKLKSFMYITSINIEKYNIGHFKVSYR